MPRGWASKSVSCVEERHSRHFPVCPQLSMPAASVGQPMLRSFSIFALESVPNCWTAAKETFSFSSCAVTPKWRLGRMKSGAKRLRSSEEADQMIQPGRANKIAAHEPPLPESSSGAAVHRTLDSLPAPASGGGRCAPDGSRRSACTIGFDTLHVAAQSERTLQLTSRTAHF